MVQGSPPLQASHRPSDRRFIRDERPRLCVGVTGQPCLWHYEALAPRDQAWTLAGLGVRI